MLHEALACSYVWWPKFAIIDIEAKVEQRITNVNLSALHPLDANASLELAMQDDHGNVYSLRLCRTFHKNDIPNNNLMHSPNMEVNSSTAQAIISK